MRTNLLTLIVSSSVVVLSGVAFADATTIPAQQSPRDPLRLTALQDGRIRMAQGRQRAVLNVESSITGCTGGLYASVKQTPGGLGYRLRVLDEVNKGGFWYVVVQVDSTPNCNVQGMCGGGSNFDVLWLKLDRRLRLVSRQAYNLQNCAAQRTLTQNTGHTDGPPEFGLWKMELQRGVLRTRFQDAGAAPVNLHYDHRWPERGLVKE